MGKKRMSNKNEIQMDTVDKILKLFPELKKEKKRIMSQVVHKPNEVIEIPKSLFIIEGFIHNNKMYYRDDRKTLWTRYYNVCICNDNKEKENIECDKCGYTVKIAGVYEIVNYNYKYYFRD